MSIQDLGSIGEVVAALATLGTMIYLALQIRQNTKSMKSSVEQTVVESITAPFHTTAQGDFPLIYMRATQDPSSLTESEAAQFGFFVSSYLKRLEQAHSQYLDGNLSAGAWNGIDAGVRIQLQSLGLRRFWDVRKTTFNSEFRKYVENAMSGESSSIDTLGAVDVIRGADGDA